MFKDASFLFSSETEVYPEVLVESQNIEIRFLLKTSLLIWKYRVLESTNFVDTQELIAEKKPALILMDCDSGFEEDLIKIRVLRKSRVSSRIPLIAFSDYTQSYNHQLFFAAGATEHLVKPIDFEKLGNLIEENIKRSYQLSSGGLL